MSGGHFDYKQYDIGQIADSIDQLIINNNKLNEYNYANNFSEKTLNQFRRGTDLCKKAQIFAQRIDWLVSGDDDEESFYNRLKEDLNKLDNESNNEKTI